MESYGGIKMAEEEYVRATIKYLHHIVTRKERQIRNNCIECSPVCCVGKNVWGGDTEEGAPQNCHSS